MSTSTRTVRNLERSVGQAQIRGGHTYGAGVTDLRSQSRLWVTEAGVQAGAVAKACRHGYLYVISILQS